MPQPDSTLPLGKWLQNASEDGPWHTDEYYDTREEAILAAIHDYGEIVGGCVWTGKVAECPFPRGFMAPVHLDQIGESFDEKLGEEIGEASEGFDWFGAAEERAAKKSGNADAWRARNEAEKGVCEKIEKVIEQEMIAMGLWKKNHWFTLDDMECTVVDEDMLLESLKQHSDEHCSDCGAEMPATVQDCVCQDKKD